MVRQPLFLLSAVVTGLGLALAGAPVLASTITEQSIWSKDNALTRARSQLPAGAVITNSQCQTVEVGLDNERYICTITYEVPTSGMTPPGTDKPGTASP